MVSAVMLATSTYAWFTMNKTVTVTGMEVKTKVGSNLLVSETPNDANFAKELTQSRQALLEPTSTVDGIQYFYTVNAGSNGDALSDNYVAYNEAGGTSQNDTAAAKSKYDAAFNTAYGTTPSTTAFDTAYGYVDYAFYLKATNTDTGDAGTVVMSKCNLLYNSTGDTWIAPTDKAWRVAMFVQELGASVTDGTAPTLSGEPATYSGALKKTILRIDGAANQSGTNAVATGTTLSAATYDTAAVVDSSMISNTTEYYYVVIRLWLEGEDTTCTSQTYAALTNKYKLDLQFDLNGGQSTSATAATHITTTP
jgi:hypothetical protein